MLHKPKIISFALLLLASQAYAMLKEGKVKNVSEIMSISNQMKHNRIISMRRGKSLRFQRDEVEPGTDLDIHYPIDENFLLTIYSSESEIKFHRTGDKQNLSVVETPFDTRKKTSYSQVPAVNARIVVDPNGGVQVVPK